MFRARFMRIPKHRNEIKQKKKQMPNRFRLKERNMLCTDVFRLVFVCEKRKKKKKEKKMSEY